MGYKRRPIDLSKIKIQSYKPPAPCPIKIKECAGCGAALESNKCKYCGRIV